MLKLYADFTTLTEKDMSAPRLKNLWRCAIVSLPCVPLFGMLELDILPGSTLNLVPDWVELLILFVSSVALLILCSNRLINRVWVRDKYLDEWELRLKHRSMAFGLQFTLYTIAVLMVVGVLLSYLGYLVLPESTPALLGYSLFSLFMVGLYSQLFAQLSLIQPIEDDEHEDADVARRPMKGIFLISAAAFGLLIILPFGLGVHHGFQDAHTVALVADKAKAECESRQSSVHWVTSKNGGDFACFDENRPHPDDVETTPKTPAPE